MSNCFGVILTNDYARPCTVYDSNHSPVQVPPRNANGTISNQVLDCFLKWRIPASNIERVLEPDAIGFAETIDRVKARMGSNDVLFLYMRAFAWSKMLSDPVNVAGGGVSRYGVLVLANYVDADPSDLTMRSIRNGIEEREFRKIIRQIVAGTARKVVVLMDFKESTMVMGEGYEVECRGVTMTRNTWAPIRPILNEPSDVQISSARITYICPYSNIDDWRALDYTGSTPFVRTLGGWSFGFNGVSGYDQYMRTLLDPYYLESVRQEYARNRSICWYESWVCWIQQLFIHYNTTYRGQYPPMHLAIGTATPVSLDTVERPPFPPLSIVTRLTTCPWISRILRLVLKLHQSLGPIASITIATPDK